MIAADEDALICDFAEVYHIYDYKALPASYAATLACGLGRDSRIKRALRGESLTLTDTLLAGILDTAKLLLCAWAGGDPPESVLEQLTRKTPSAEGFETGESFEARRRAVLERSEE